MSIIQVMDSTKSGRIIYVVAASLIVVGITVAIFQTTGQEFTPAIDSNIVLVPIIGLLSLLLWIGKPDRSIIEYSAIRYIYKRKEISNTKVRMASALLYVRPWESSPKSASTIEESLRNELDRTLRSPELKEQIDNYKQAFWLILLTPFSLITLVVFYQLPWWLMAAAGIIVGSFLSRLILYENRETLTRVIEYSFARWFHEEASTDLSRRESGFGEKSYVKVRLAATLEIVTPTIDLVVRGDWKGFDWQRRNLEQLIGIPTPDELNWSQVADYVSFVDSIVRTIHDPKFVFFDGYLKNSRLQNSDAIEVLRNSRTKPFTTEEEMIASISEILLEYTSGRDLLLQLDCKLYERLERVS